METKMSVLGDGYDPFYSTPKSISMTINEVSEDPFWDAFEHAVRMVGFFNILPDRECDYWFELIDDQEYPSEEELDTFVSICKEGMKSITETSDCTFVGLVNSVDNIEGYWPYA